jgi:hypothetical protein
VEEREAASVALVTELKRLRSERDEAAAQLRFTQAALQLEMDEREVLRGRLLQAERSAQDDPLPQNVVPGQGLKQCGAVVWSLGEEEQTNLVTGGAQDMPHLEADMPASAALFYVPGAPSPSQKMQPNLRMPVPHPFPSNESFPVESTCSTPLPSPEVMESEQEAITVKEVATVAPQTPPVEINLPSPEATVEPQEEMVPLRDKNCHGNDEYPKNHPGIYDLRDNKSYSQEDLEGPQEMAPLGDNNSHSHKEDSVMLQRMAALCSGRSQSHKKNPERPQTTPVGNSRNHSMKKSPKKPHPPRLKVKQPQAKKASESQQQEKPASCQSSMNWVCSWCKTKNPPWRQVCYKCKNVCTLGESDPGETH